MPIRNKEKLEALAAKLAKVPTSTPEYKNWMQRLDKAAQNGNQEAKYTLDKTIEYATANRKDYSELQEFAMAATAGVPGISGFAGSKIGEKYGTAGSIVGGVLGGLVGASHDVMNIGRNIKKSKLKKGYKNFEYYSTSEITYSDEPIKVDDIKSYLAERLKTGAADRIGWSEDYNTIPDIFEDNVYLPNNKFKNTEKIWDFIQNYTPSKILDYKGSAISSPETKEVLIKSYDDLTTKDVNIPTIFEYPVEGKHKKINPYVKYDNSKITKEDYRNIVDHELYHVVKPRNFIKEFRPDVDPEEFLDITANDEFLEHLLSSNAEELNARLIQIKNHNGITDGSKMFSGKELKEMFDNYLKDGGMDNNMLDLYSIITDWDKLAKWMNRMVPVLAPAHVIEWINNNRKDHSD